MPRIDFYILNSDSELKRLDFACRLLAKIYTQGHQAAVLCDSTNSADNIDRQLWTYSDISFIPHGLAKSQSSAPILIYDNQDQLPEQNSIILNLSKHKVNINQLDRLLEIIDNQPDIKSSARERYKSYQSMGLEISTHKM